MRFDVETELLMLGSCVFVSLPQGSCWGVEQGFSIKKPEENRTRHVVRCQAQGKPATHHPAVRHAAPGLQVRLMSPRRPRAEEERSRYQEQHVMRRVMRPDLITSWGLLVVVVVVVVVAAAGARGMPPQVPQPH
ncbi:hypothetical protein E2C01_010908 [Portunus trituberculatus]|uniref:Uncharacterized protein n=1 Tax=Portunus trituberculatus TaxID=210409 RepID=A0A5B7DA49_PORTR|nr:hypothetical protein [Portunus trituberculatus]